MTMNIKLIRIIISFPLLLPHLLLRFHSKHSGILEEDQIGTLRNRANPFNGTILQFVWFFVNLKEYRNVFYHRIGGYKYLIKWMFPAEKTCFIRTPSKRLGGVFLSITGIRWKSMPFLLGRTSMCFRMLQ